jgi:hypothetical protein
MLLQSDYLALKSNYARSTYICVALKAAEMGGAAISSQIIVHKRGRPTLDRSKQLAAYLVHVSLSVQFTSLSSYLKCDRATVEAACGRIEDLRDNRQLDQLIHLYETALIAWVDAFEINPNL